MAYERDDYGPLGLAEEEDVRDGIAALAYDRERHIKAKEVLTTESKHEELTRLLAENPIIYFGSPIHDRIEELRHELKRKVKYTKPKRFDLLYPQGKRLLNSGRIVALDLPKPIPVLEFNKRHVDSLIRNPTQSLEMFTRTRQKYGLRGMRMKRQSFCRECRRRLIFSWKASAVHFSSE
jgi:hypothetical protein